MASVESITQAGPWTLGERLGFNGAVATYKARHGSTNEHAVVVALDRAVIASPPHLAYFKAEFPRLAALPPGGLCKPFDTGDEPAFVWAAYDWYPGRHLGSYVQEHGLPTPGQSLRVLARLIPALQTLHDAQAVHRLITPASIFLHADLSVRLLHTCWSGLLLGVVDGPASPFFISNLPFLAPEIARGEPGDAAADVYSIGANLFFLMSGQPTHWHEDPRVLAHTIGTVPVSIEPLRQYVAPGVLALLGELLEISPDDRPVNLEALAERMLDLANQIDPMPQPLAGSLIPGVAPIDLPPDNPHRSPTEESGDDDTKRLLEMARMAANKRGDSSAHVPVGQAMAAPAAAGLPGLSPQAVNSPGAIPPPPPPRTATPSADKKGRTSTASTLPPPQSSIAKEPAAASSSPLIIFGTVMAVLLLVLIGALLYILFGMGNPPADPGPVGRPPVVAGDPGNTSAQPQPADGSPRPTPTPRPSPTPTQREIEYAETIGRMKRLATANMKHMKDFGTWARRQREIKAVGADDADLRDSWGVDLDLRDKGFIVSSGPDMKWDTADDFWIESKETSVGGWKP